MITMRKLFASAALSAMFAGAALAQTPQPSAPTKPAAPVAAPATPAKPVTPTAAPAAGQTQKINLNTATAKELDSLPQIGEARSKAIVEARAKSKFKDWNDFVARSVVPKNAEEAIKDKVSF